MFSNWTSQMRVEGFDASKNKGKRAKRVTKKGESINGWRLRAS